MSSCCIKFQSFHFFGGIDLITKCTRFIHLCHCKTTTWLIKFYSSHCKCLRPKTESNRIRACWSRKIDNCCNFWVHILGNQPFMPGRHVTHQEAPFPRKTTSFYLLDYVTRWSGKMVLKKKRKKTPPDLPFRGTFMHPQNTVTYPTCRILCKYHYQSKFQL